ncbi:site-specific integrase [Cupriavidus sp. AcVe19-1a]|uniref:site-specific integrase n=1 Tax=Cupriavidus sp. AcVe19-1a TaxID=2821359 RepID=UPI001AEB4B29|nr:site-specific integrase [Cupriavidus sp. AcVe19-1a]MBP0633671.1 site-specific integrase [Cupriavidus sp. AcVe19-1a]
MTDLCIPDLTFPTVKYGRTETPWDLRPLLYRGGASTDIRKVHHVIAGGALGPPMLDRLTLVLKLHDVLAGNIAAGGSRYTVRIAIARIRSFYAWADESNCSLTLATVETDFLEWTNHLIHRQRLVGDIGAVTVYNLSSHVARLLDEVLSLKVGLLRRTRVNFPPSKRKVLGTKADKQNLADTFAFGHALLDISDALTVDSIRGKLPVMIRFRSGQQLEEWSGLPPDHKLKTLVDPTATPSRKEKVINRRAAWESDTSLRTRQPLINLRIEAELLIFIAQTGMNLSQAHKLVIGRFSYQSHLDGYLVRRVYKDRRQGEVEFAIYSEYRTLFERYLAWHRAIFQDGSNGLLFPLSSRQERARDVSPLLRAIRVRCALLKIPFVGPRSLRSVRVNWLMRRSRDPALTAEMNQHTTQTLLREYIRPHHQAAIKEISRFHSTTDPAMAPPGPGVCVKGDPQLIQDASAGAPHPDCISPAGCLFCIHQRDIDSADHAWSLASYGHYKSLELAMYRPPKKADVLHPAMPVLDRITAKLEHFKTSSEARAFWVGEAMARVEEGDFHPKWDGFIQLAEFRR